MNNRIRKPKRSYDTQLIYLFQSGLLPERFQEGIPSSTLHNWKSRNLDNIWSFRISEEELSLHKALAGKKTFSRLCRALYYAFSLYESFINKMPDKKKLFLKSKEAIINSIEKISMLVGKERALRFLSVSSQQLSYWKAIGKCNTSSLFLCFKKHPLQISSPELTKIKMYFRNHPLWSAKAIYYQMMREGSVFLSLSSFYKYASLLGLNESVPVCRRKKHVPGIRASVPKEIIHMDVTVFRPLDNSKVYIYLIVDNFSRCILSWKASLVLSGELCMENLKEAVMKHSLFNSSVDIIVDGGSENNCINVNEFLDGTSVRKLIAQKDILFSNSMVEAAHKHLKYQYLFKKDLYSLEDVMRYMEFSVRDHSNKPHGALFGLTPLEVLNGGIPRKDMFREDIRKARIERIKWNKKGCEKCENLLLYPN